MKNSVVFLYNYDSAVRNGPEVQAVICIVRLRKCFNVLIYKGKVSNWHQICMGSLNRELSALVKSVVLQFQIAN